VFKLIVFDLDGTLIDSKRDLANAVNALLIESGALPLPVAQVGRMVGDGAATLVARAFHAAGVPKPPDALERFVEIYGRHLTDCTRPYDGIPEVLTTLRRRATLAVLTNKPLAPTRIILDRLDLARHFSPELIVGGDGPFPRKPDPGSLRHLMAHTGIDNAATLLVGDSLIDWRTAHAAGTSICLARYGFGFEGFPVERLAAANFVIDAPPGLLGL
jgi:phosphoglycolate phosphatase